MRKVTSNISELREDFFKTRQGLEFPTLDATPTAPEDGLRFYSRNNKLYYLDHSGVETEVVTEFTTNNNFYEVLFDYTGTFPTTICSVQENERIISVILIIESPFNDENAIISIGHTGDSNGLMSITDNAPTIASIYELQPNIRYGGLDVIKLYVNIGTSTQGSGVLLLQTTITRDV